MRYRGKTETKNWDTTKEQNINNRRISSSDFPIESIKIG